MTFGISCRGLVMLILTLLIVLAVCAASSSKTGSNRCVPTSETTTYHVDDAVSTVATYRIKSPLLTVNAARAAQTFNNVYFEKSTPRVIRPKGLTNNTDDTDRQSVQKLLWAFVLVGRGSARINQRPQPRGPHHKGAYTTNKTEKREQSNCI